MNRPDGRSGWHIARCWCGYKKFYALSFAQWPTTCESGLIGTVVRDDSERRYPPARR
ncbi:hypothetical protein KCP74_18650 [Salmonella enterica subsp. enterica]|nr:hypothetical protein KCP74_18650 [Salmonella enterica subsp. enterica]